MKIIAVGDVHGRGFWKEVAAKEHDFDKFVFVGDYFDNFPPMTQKRIFDNFKDIVAFKEAYPDRVKLLLGNHDFQYMLVGSDSRCSGYSETGAMNITPFIEFKKHLFSPAYENGNLLFTHAGVTKTWLDDIGFNENTADKGVAHFINYRFTKSPKKFLFNKLDTSGCGEHPAQGCMWVRPRSLFEDMYAPEGLIQVVGHTGVSQIQNIEGKLVLIDAAKSREYLKVEDGVAVIGKISPS